MGAKKKTVRTYRSKARTIRGLAGCQKRLGQRIRRLRKESDPPLSQEALAGKAQLDAKHLQTLEAGVANPTLASLLALSRALGVSLSELMDGV